MPVAQRLPTMAISVTYRVRIPYPFERVLSQYFDLEHLETVHPTTLGAARVLELDGRRIVFEQRWPAWLGLRLRTVAEQVWLPPDRIRIRFRRGLLRGVGVDTHLMDRGDETVIEETYRLPLVPGWSWLRPLVSRVVDRAASHIWEEDLAVELCHGGWPGVPGQEPPAAASSPVSAPAASGGRWIRVADRSDLDAGQARTVVAGGREIAVWQHGGRLHALDNRCSHTGGPLALGRVEQGQVVCPWHGARFALADGKPCGGPADGPVTAYPVRQEGRGVFVGYPPAATRPVQAARTAGVTRAPVS